MEKMHNETYEQKRRRLFGKVNFLPAYLQQLNKLLNIEVTADMLLSIVETDCFLEQIDFNSDTLFYKETIPFEDKENLQRIVWSKLLDWNTNYMMELTNVKECGLLPILIYRFSIGTSNMKMKRVESLYLSDKIKRKNWY